MGSLTEIGLGFCEVGWVLRFLGEGGCCFCWVFFLEALDMRTSKAEGGRRDAIIIDLNLMWFEEKRDLWKKGF